MIETNTSPPATQQVRNLAAKAEKLALAHAAMKRADEMKWRNSAFVWPLLGRR